MSWSVEAVGSAQAVAVKLAKDFAACHCIEPEETIKNTIAGAVASALAAFPPAYPVRVSASGNQSSERYDDPACPKVNQLKVEIAPIWNYLE